MNTSFRLTGFALLCLLATPPAAHAAIITDLFNTGQAAIGSPDPNYTLTSGLNPPATVRTPNIGWLSAPAGSEWIGPDGINGVSFVYETQFTLPSIAVLASVIVSGEFASDNATTDILINGVSTGIDNFGASPFVPFTTLTPFTLPTSALVHGVNTIEFLISNDSATSDSGLLVTNTSGTFTAVPEPTTVASGLVGLVGLAALRRRRCCRRRCCRRRGC